MPGSSSRRTGVTATLTIQAPFSRWAGTVSAADPVIFKGRPDVITTVRPPPAAGHRPEAAGRRGHGNRGRDAGQFPDAQLLPPTYCASGGGRRPPGLPPR